MFVVLCDNVFALQNCMRKMHFFCKRRTASPSPVCVPITFQFMLFPGVWDPSLQWVNPQSSDTLCYQTCWNSLASPLNNLVLMISRNVGSFIVFWNQLAMAEVDCCWDNEPGRDSAGPLPEPYVNEPALSITLATIGCQKFPELLVCFVYLADSSISLKASHSGLIYFCTFSFFRV